MSTENRANRRLPKEVIDIPNIPRKYGLLYLVDRLGSMRRGQVEQLAAVLDTDMKQDIVRPLAKVSYDAQLVEAVHSREFDRDTFLNYAALSYDGTELHQEYSMEPRLPTEVWPRSPADLLAGGGSPRPLLLEMYSLKGIDLLAIRRDEDDGQEVFTPTSQGTALATAHREIFEDLVDFGGKRNFLVVMTRFDTNVQQYQHHIEPSMFRRLLGIT